MGAQFQLAAGARYAAELRILLVYFAAELKVVLVYLSESLRRLGQNGGPLSTGSTFFIGGAPSLLPPVEPPLLGSRRIVTNC